MATLAEVMDATAEALSVVAGVEVYGYPVDKPEAPCLIVEWPESIDVATYFGDDSGTIFLPVRAVVPHVDDRSSVLALQELIAAALSALQADSTLDGVVSSATATTVGEFGRLVVNEALVGDGAVISLEVLAD
jgi:hypothetical protein